MTDARGIRHCILVEDDEVDAEMTRRAFAASGTDLELEVASDGLEALRRLGEHPRRRAVLLLDLKLPRMGGIELLEAVRKDSATRSVPAFVLTTSSDPRDLRRAYDLGIAGYFVKPDSTEALAEIVAMVTAYCRNVELPAD